VEAEAPALEKVRNVAIIPVVEPPYHVTTE
jgi:hypothetical protein